MTDTTAALLCLSPFLLTLAVPVGLIVHSWVEEFEHSLWPRGLRWFPAFYLGACHRLHRAWVGALWPERVHTLPSRRLRELEEANDTWNTWVSTGVPVWEPSGDGRWGEWRPRRFSDAGPAPVDHTLPESWLRKPGTTLER